MKHIIGTGLLAALLTGCTVDCKICCKHPEFQSDTEEWVTGTREFCETQKEVEKKKCEECEEFSRDIIDRMAGDIFDQAEKESYLDLMDCSCEKK